MKTKLLIVDDEPGIVDMMKSYFEPHYDVLTARNGDEALQKVSAAPDLILLDINMPEMDGLPENPGVCRLSDSVPHGPHRVCGHCERIWSRCG